MWKLLSLKQKMYHLCETHSCHMIPDLFYKRWLQVHLWMLLTTLSWEIMDFICEYKSSETPTFILGVLSFPLLACILATLKTALHMKLYIKRPLYIDHLSGLYIKRPVKEKNKILQKYLDSTGWNLRLFWFKMQGFKSQAFGG